MKPELSVIDRENYIVPIWMIYIEDTAQETLKEYGEILIKLASLKKQE